MIAAGTGFCAGAAFILGLYGAISGQGAILANIFLLTVGSTLIMGLLMLPLIILRLLQDKDSKGNGDGNKRHEN